MPKLPLEGACRCGALTYSVATAPHFALACHCTDCQQLSASAFSLGLVVEDAAFFLIGSAHVWAKTGESGGESRRYTCGLCATWLFTRSDASPGLTIVRPTTLNDHRWITPVAQIYTRSALPWALLAVPFSFETEVTDPAPLRQAFTLSASLS